MANMGSINKHLFSSSETPLRQTPLINKSDPASANSAFTLSNCRRTVIEESGSLGGHQLILLAKVGDSSEFLGLIRIGHVKKDKIVSPEVCLG